MIKKLIPFTVLGAALVGFGACKNDSFKKTKTGLEYRIVKDEKGDKKPAVGDLVQMHLFIHYKDDKIDSVLFNSRSMNNNQPIEFPVMASQFKGDWPEGIMLMTPGDSAIFKVSVDSVKKLSQGQIPPFMKAGQKIYYNVVLVSLKSQEQAQKEQEMQASAQKETDDRIIQDYLSKNNIQAQKTASGLYYSIDKEGTGATPQSGQTVSVNYTGKTLDGNTFDSNVDPKFQHVEPFKFVAGQGQVIPGWDEGVMLLKKGGKARLFVPSPLAYGPQSPGPGIEPNSVLIFDVEVLDIQ